MFLPCNNTRYSDYQYKIREAIDKFLPGEKAQYKMAPVDRPAKVADSSAREAGVLLLIYPSNGSIYTVLIQRPVYDGVHSGQISLPGGKKENQDKDLLETAIRETEEEIGITKEDVKILGELTPLFIPVSNNLVQPFIGSLGYEPKLTPEPREVEKIYTIKLKDLLDPTCVIDNEIFVENNRRIRAPFYKIDELQIWGATAMILSEFIELNEKILLNSYR